MEQEEKGWAESLGLETLKEGRKIEDFTKSKKGRIIMKHEVFNELSSKDAPIEYTNEESFAWASGYNSCLEKESDRLETYLTELFEQVKHGDQEHQDWLKKKFDDYLIERKK